MSRPRLATVLTARDWEARLVDTARAVPLVRIVRRAYEPEDLERTDHVDVLVAGSETSWITAPGIRGIRGKGIRVIGLFPPGDHPGRELLRAGGCDLTLPDDHPSELIIEHAIELSGSPVEEASGHLIVVTGPRGAPGRSEVALALAWTIGAHRKAIMLDLDEAPSLGIRLGLTPGLDMHEVAELVLRSGTLPPTGIAQTGPSAVVTGPPRSGSPLAEQLAEAVLEAARRQYEVVIADLGVHRPDDPLLRRADVVVLVGESSPIGVVRVAALARDWMARQPLLVLNKAGGDPEPMTTMARRATGLEPSLIIPYLDQVREASRTAGPPPLVLQGLTEPLSAQVIEAS